MSAARVDEIVRAVVYEGHILYPYRATAVKNRRRFTFGRVYPRAYAALQAGKERCTMRTQCLIEGRSRNPEVSFSIRFLQPASRELFDARGRRVPRIDVGHRVYYDWQEVEERSIEGPRPKVGHSPQEHPFYFDASTRRDQVLDGEDSAGSIRRRRAALTGVIRSSLEEVARSVFRLTIEIENQTSMPAPLIARLQDRAARPDEDELVLYTFVSTHAVLHVQHGRFVSMIDPPESLANAAAACRSEGVWPVLVGDRARCDTMLCSPIILYDFPEIAPESAGDLFDATEIDELLTLRIQTLTEKEKQEMRSVDAIARRLLDRTESLDPEELLGMHGAARDEGRPSADQPAAALKSGASSPPKSGGSLKPAAAQHPARQRNPDSEIRRRTPRHVKVGGRLISVGDRVRIRPKGRGDVLDLALAGRTGLIEAIEQDFEDQLYLALVIEDDPGRDLGMLRQPGHRFFFGLDEIEPV